MRLLFARHGETDWNAQRRFLGSTDLPLNAHGQTQARALAGRVPDGIDVIVASPLQRAAQTAAAVAERLALPVAHDDAFVERCVGVFEGLNLEEITARYPDEWARKVARQWALAPQGGESIEAVFARVGEGLLRLQQQYAGQTVLLVAHAFVGRVVHALHQPLDAEGFFAYVLDNAQLVEYGQASGLRTLDEARSSFLAPPQAD
ncbi:probable phosphoglycerate mutase [Andreprevotia lacus DSM 23236]|jgi:probable phosphoglycerate mutase|uniref:phosphoglycerate mutase (2,3-diphosphoglycerate-dependent) n=1 Tax=Andreprevotia lacus DSM 23236 TaxID=1121001 RepID=A0A1W1X5B8_9NEIS|nr:histidine phosphatase family protein [Andreprevotia lacus]SMC19047.1 probable phosphoglycerate mutase [Andreprevotia lacus DSM 23236]